MPGRNAMKGLNRIIVIVSFVAGSAVSVPAAPSAVPFRLHQHLIVVNGSVNGRTDLNLVIDTGATYTVMSNRLCKTLKVRTRKVSAASWGKQIKVRAGRLEAVSIGDTVFEDVETRVGNLSIASGLQVDLLVGLNLLRRTTVTVDYARKLLILGAHTEFTEQKAFYPNLPFLLIRMNVQGKRLAMILDTGSPFVVFFGTEVADRVDMTLTNETEQIAHAAGDLTLRKIVVSETQLGQTTLGAITAFLMDASSAAYGGAAGILGPTSLGLQRLHLDFEANRISWEF
jgi:predicted aspartyl protease